MLMYQQANLFKTAHLLPLLTNLPITIFLIENLSIVTNINTPTATTTININSSTCIQPKYGQNDSQIPGLMNKF